MKRTIRAAILIVLIASMAPAGAVVGDARIAALFVNALGLDLLWKTDPTANALLSPYSIQAAMAMTYRGADGETRAEMAKVLHYPPEESEPAASFGELEAHFEGIAQETRKDAVARGDSNQVITFVVANRLFGEKSYPFRDSFTSSIKLHYNAMLQPMDFAHDAAGAGREINLWVEKQTRRHSRGSVGCTHTARAGERDLSQGTVGEAVFGEDDAAALVSPLRREGRTGSDHARPRALRL
jgi:serine protease inhibitor